MPQPFIEGDKVVLRPFGAHDIADEYLGWLNDPLLMRYSNQRFVHHDRDSSLRYLASFEGSPNFFFGVCDRANERLLGTLTAYVAPQHGTADMGIMIGAPAARGRGFGFDAWSTLMAWLLEARGLRKVTAGTLGCNAPMLRLMHASGMQPDGVRRSQEMIDGAAQDILYFARFGDA